MLGALLVSCANEDLTQSNVTGGDVKDEFKGYITVSLVAPGGFTTKAADYQYGTKEESSVSNVRFYFYDADENPAYVRKNPTAVGTDGSSLTANDLDNNFYSFIDWDPSDRENGQPANPGADDNTPSTSETVEKVLTTTIVINGPEGELYKNPAYIVAVVNPTSDIRALGNAKLNDVATALRSQVDNYKDGLVKDGLVSEGSFLMTNSVFVDGLRSAAAADVAAPATPTTRYAHPIAASALSQTSDLSQKDPVLVYVERVVARLDLSFDSQLATKDNESYLYDTKDTFTAADPYAETAPAETKVYAKFLGWALTSEPKTSRLIKDVHKGWDYNMFGASEPWNTDNYNRSYWAINPDFSTKTLNEAYNWVSYNEIFGGFPEVSAPADGTRAEVTLKGYPLSGQNPKMKTYTQENANPYSAAETGANPEEPTKVIFAAQLVDEDENPVQLAYYNLQYYTIDGLKDLAAHIVDLYYLKDEKYLPLEGSQLSFLTQNQYVNATKDTDADEVDPIGQTGGYFSYFTISDETVTTWYHKDPTKEDGDSSQYQPLTSMDMNKYLYDVLGKALVWNNGMTYYYFEIAHLGYDKDATEANMKTGHFGVVRNHIYNSTVSSIKGFGTPVWDPKEEIYPEHPEKTGTQFQAQVKVLEWRLVNQSYDLTW